MFLLTKSTRPTPGKLGSVVEMLLVEEESIGYVRWPHGCSRPCHKHSNGKVKAHACIMRHAEPQTSQMQDQPLMSIQLAVPALVPKLEQHLAALGRIPVVVLR